MKKMNFVRSVMVGALLAAYGAGAAAQAVDEVEPNFPIATPQALQFDSFGVATVNAFMGDGDADLFSFQAKAGDVVTLDIDGGAKNGAPGHIDTFMGVHLPETSGYVVMRGNDDAALDAGSVGSEDSYIANLVIPADGVYVVSVAGYPNQVVDGGVFRGSTGNMTGSYTLIVSGVSPVVTEPAPEPEPEPVPAPESEPVPSPFPQEPVEVQKITIDIKPGLRRIAKIDPKSRREIPIALLGARGFDVRKVDVDSLTFGRTGDEQSLKRCKPRPERVNRDRRADLVCFFENQQAGFEATDEEGILRGVTVDGKPFEGTGMLKVVSEKRKHKHDRRDRRDRWDHRGR
jgi:hypothetical protein